MNTVSCRIYKGRIATLASLAIGLGLCLAPGPAGAQETSTAHAVVTATQKSAEDVTTVPRQTISVFENRKPREVAGWVPLRGGRSGLQLVVLLDDSARTNLG